MKNNGQKNTQSNSSPTAEKPDDQQAENTATNGNGSAFKELDLHDLSDNPVLIYLHDIGKVSLLNAREEKFLASRIEEARHLRKIERENAFGNAEVMLHILRQIITDRYLIDSIAGKLGLACDDSFNLSIRQAELRDIIDGVIAEELVESISADNGKISDEVWHDCIELSIYIRLLPSQLFDTIGDETSWHDIEKWTAEPANSGLLVKLESVSEYYQVHINEIKSSAAISAKRLIESNLRLVSAWPKNIILTICLCWILFRREISGWSVPLKNLNTERDSSSVPMQPGGSGRRSPVP
jgi:DNA-directed RNA polymerase sigma subunit (sigma70/sigma32)